MNTKRLTATINSIQVYRDEIIVSLKGALNDYLYFIHPENVKWEYEDKLTGCTVSRKLKENSVIEFDGNVCTKTRRLYNVVIIG